MGSVADVCVDSVGILRTLCKLAAGTSGCAVDGVDCKGLASLVGCRPPRFGDVALVCKKPAKGRSGAKSSKFSVT
jgi:hypothetical protein